VEGGDWKLKRVFDVEKGSTSISSTRDLDRGTFSLYTLLSNATQIRLYKGYARVNMMRTIGHEYGLVLRGARVTTIEATPGETRERRHQRRLGVYQCQVRICHRAKRRQNSAKAQMQASTSTKTVHMTA
jgi:hypothetical protein